jgi:curli production assembly/transport component CsgG/holdfast attachment protein HfaB
MPLAITLSALMLSGCVSLSADDETGQYATPIGNAPVTSNETAYSRALACVAAARRGKPIPRIAVGQIVDYTGKAEADGAGRKLTQGAALMAMSALAKAGISLVERYDTSVAELELKYANNRLISAATPQDPGYRRILAGSIPGSDFYLVGGITELNYNIRSMGADAFGAGTATTDAKGTIGFKAYVMNIGLDLRLVDSHTLEVVDVISYQKQIVGREVQAGVFDILGTTIVDAGAGESALEPMQLAVRAVVERAVLEMTKRLYRMGPDTCGVMGDDGDPLAGGETPSASAAPATQTTENANDSRQNVYHGYSARSRRPSLRGRL